MNVTPLHDVRRIIPRWRESRTTLATGELVSSNSIKKPAVNNSEWFNQKLHKWQELQNIELAAEVVSAGISLGFVDESVTAAKYLTSEEENTTPIVLSIANEIIRRSEKRHGQDTNQIQQMIIDRPFLYNKIRSIKYQLIDYPRNALMWADLSLYYVMLDQIPQSQNAMNIALILAPNNRFILRSATRLFVHIDEPDRAHQLLIRKEITRTDPWLIAAEIAVAAVAERKPLLIRNGRDILERKKYSPFHTAELSSAIATFELFSGAHKKAKKLFQSSLINPTDNSVAQSEWARRQLPSLDNSLAVNNTPRTYEAKARKALQSLDWNVVVDSAKLWSLDEFYSSRPAEFGGFAAMVGLQNYSLGETLTRAALIANPNDLKLINNLAFSIANQGRLDDARIIIDDVQTSNLAAQNYIPLIATRGLINIRNGDTDVGRALYLKAILLAEHSEEQDLLPLASINYAREMFLAGMFSKAEAISFAEKSLRSGYSPHISFLLDQLKATSAPRDFSF